MNDADRLRLLFGPYRTPRCTAGGTLRCRLRGRVPDRLPGPATAGETAAGFMPVAVPAAQAERSNTPGHNILTFRRVFSLADPVPAA